MFHPDLPNSLKHSFCILTLLQYSLYSCLQKLDDARFGIQPVDDDDGTYYTTYILIYKPNVVFFVHQTCGPVSVAPAREIHFVGFV